MSTLADVSAGTVGSGGEASSARAEHVGQAIATSLELHGISRVFSVPGESYLAVLDGLYSSGIHNVVCRHEGGAAYMAEAYGRATGGVGVAMVTRGPGAANAFVAVHVAAQDASPLVLFVGLIPTGDRNRSAFQEFDPNAWFGTQTKRVFVLDAPARASEVVAEAFHAAQSGRPGPVVVCLPEDVVAAPFTGTLHPPIPVGHAEVAASDLAVIRAELDEASRPLMLVGGEGWTVESAAAVTKFAEQHHIPVLQDWHAVGRVPTGSPAHIGQVAFGGPGHAVRALEEADVLLCVGTVPGDVTTNSFQIRQRTDAVNLIVNPDPDLIGRSGPVRLHAVVPPATFARQLTDLQLQESAERAEWAATLRTEFELERDTVRPPAGTKASMTRVVQRVATATDDVLVTLGAGNHSGWAQLFDSESYPSELAPRNGSMGYSIPAAVAAATAFPNRMVVALAGDGEFQMNGQELATAVQEGVGFLVILMDNGQFGTIRVHQEREYPGRVSGTQMVNPDFAAVARAYGAVGERVETDDDVDGAVDRALDAVRAGRVALLHVLVDPAVLTP